MRLFWSVAVGGAVGCLSRFYLATFVQQRVGPSFPGGTLLINVTGSFLLGFLMRYALQSGSISPATRAMVTTGFCGGYTTFSTFSYETALMLEDGEYGRAATYVGASVAVSLVFTFLGFAAANQLLALRQVA
jgi:CrcB protein